MKSPRNRVRPQPRTPRGALRAGDPVEPAQEPTEKSAESKKAPAKKTTRKKRTAPSDE